MSSIKQKLKIYILFGTSSEVTILSKVINFSRVITLKISFLNNLAIFFYLDMRYYWDSLVFISPWINILNMLTYFKSFLYCLQLRLFDTKGINARNACIGGVYAGDTYVRDVYIEGTCCKRG